MKNLFAFFVLCALCASASAQIQNGLVREQNSKRRPISGAEVNFANAVPTTSDNDGNFRLAFEGKKPGQLIFLREIKKSGYELVNGKDLEILKVSSTDTLGEDIIMAKAGTVDAAKKEYYGVSDKALRAGFEKEKKSLYEELNQAQINQQEYSDKFAALQEQYDNQKKELDQLAEKFARVNFDDVESLYQEALQLFKAGKIDEAIAALESADPAKLIEQIIGQEKQDADDEKKLIARKQATAKTKQKIIAQVRLLADMYSVKFNPAKAEALFDGLVRLDSTDLSILTDASDFYREQHRYDKAKRAYGKIIVHTQAEPWKIARAHGNLGELHTFTGSLQVALSEFTTFYEAYKKLLAQDPVSPAYRSSLAISYSKLGKTHTALGNLDTALTYYEDYYRLEKELYDAYPQNVEFKHGLAISYEKLGSTHTALGNLDKALTYYQELNRLEKELYDAYPQNVEFKNGLATSYSKLGEAHTALANLEKALTYFEKDLQLTKELCGAYPQNVEFKYNLALSYQYLGNTHTALGNLDKALRYYQEFNRLEKELYDAYPQNVSFKGGLADSYARFGLLSLRMNDLVSGKNFFAQSKLHSSELFRDAPTNATFQAMYAEVLAVTAALVMLTEKTPESQSLLRARGLFRDLYTRTHDTYFQQKIVLIDKMMQPNADLKALVIEMSMF